VRVENEQLPPPKARETRPDREWARSVWQVVQDIPPGHVLTYGDVARLSGMPRYARRVSQAMRWAPSELALPWHRVINAQGKISFPPDSSGWQQQKDLLEEEGVVFVNGQVDLERYGYEGAVDRLCWGPVP
jgi:methylated-DNA-protein-cysteine methyltransferase-like protein